MFTEIGAVLGMASFILIIINSIVKTFSEDKDWQKRIDEINLRCDVDTLKFRVDNLRKEKDMCGYYTSKLTGKTFSYESSMEIDDLKFRMTKLEERMDTLNKDELKSELKEIIKKTKSLSDSDIDNIIDKLDRLVTKKG